MHIPTLIAGALLLLFGRRLFWLFVGVAGFLFGMQAASLLLAGQPQWMQLAVAVATGCLGALLAVLAQRVAFAFAGFAAGMYLVLVAGSFAAPNNPMVLFLAFGAGIIGAVIATLIMDSAITVLACLIGAGALVGELHAGQAMSTLAFVVLAAAGILFQERLAAGNRKD